MRDCFNETRRPSPSEASFDCADAESLDRLSDRGWVVLRGLVPLDEATALAERTRADAFCSPQIDECVLNGDRLRAQLPGFTIRRMSERGVCLCVCVCVCVMR